MASINIANFLHSCKIMTRIFCFCVKEIWKEPGLVGVECLLSNTSLASLVSSVVHLHDLIRL